MPEDPRTEHDDAPHDAEESTSKPMRPWNYQPGSYRTRNLVVAAVLLALEGLVALGYGLVWGYLSLTGEPTDQTASLTGAAFVVLAALLLLRMAYGLWKVDVWPRVPSIVIQLALVPVSWSIAFTLGNAAVGVPLLAVAIVIIVMLFSKQVREAYNRDV